MAEKENQQEERKEEKSKEKEIVGTEEEKIEETKKAGEKKLETKKAKKKQDVPKKTEAVVKRKDLPISTKYSMAICNMIRGKNPEQAIEMLEQVTRMKKAVKMKGEIPHRKGIGGGRYPVKAARIFIKLVKELNANSRVNGLDNPYIETAKADYASRPFKRGGRMRFKRTNVLLVAKEKIRKEEK